MFGKDPTIGSVPPRATRTTRPVRATRCRAANIGPQLLAFLGLVCVGPGAALRDSPGSSASLAARSRALVTVIFGAGRGVLLVLDQLHVHDVLLAKIVVERRVERARASTRRRYFNVNPGIGLLVALVILAVAVLYNLVALIVGAGPVADGAGGDRSRTRPLPPPPPPPP